MSPKDKSVAFAPEAMENKLMLPVKKSEQGQGKKKDPRCINPRLIPVKLLTFLIHGGQSATFAFITLHMKSLGISVTEIAIVLLLMPILCSIGPTLSGSLADRFGNYKIVLITFTLLSAVFSTCMWFFVPSFGVVTVLPAPINRTTWELPCVSNYLILDDAAVPREARIFLPPMQSDAESHCRIQCSENFIEETVQTQICFFQSTPDASRVVVHGVALLSNATLAAWNITTYPKPPDVRTVPLYVRQGESQVISTTTLYVTDTDTPATELIFSLTGKPTQGEVRIKNHTEEEPAKAKKLQLKETFTFQDILDGLLVYTQNNETSNSPDDDNIDLSLTDGIHKFSLSIEVRVEPAMRNTGGGYNQEEERSPCHMRDCKKICLTDDHITQPGKKSNIFGNFSETETESEFNSEKSSWFFCEAIRISPPANFGQNTVSNCRVICSTETLNTTTPETISFGSKATTISLYFIFRFLSFTSARGTFPLLDAAVMQVAKQEGGDFGVQRLFASVGAVFVPPLAGWLTMLASKNCGCADFSPAFYLFGVMTFLGAVLMYFMDIRVKQPQTQIFKTMGVVLRDPSVVAFLVAVFCSGCSWGFANGYLFLFLEDAKEFSVPANTWLLGLVNAAGYAIGIPFMFFSTQLIKRFGHENLVAGVVFCYAVRFLMYSFTYNVYLIFPTEIFTGFTFLVFIIAPQFAMKTAPKYLATLVGLFGAANFGIGGGVGPLIGGFLIHWVGFRSAYQIISISLIIVAASYLGVYHFYLKKRQIANNAPKLIVHKRIPSKEKSLEEFSLTTDQT